MQCLIFDSQLSFWCRECSGSAEDCKSTAPLELELEVVSTHPKVYIIENFFSDYEADAVIEYAKPRVSKSTVGQSDSGGVRQSETRTSSNTWMPRHSSDVANTLYLRAADLLRIDEKILESSQNAEDIQVVHYSVGEKYDAHHDWGVSGYPESRYITLLLYLNNMPDEYSGGETSFPKGNNGHGFKVLPKRRTAVLFYSLLEDGNGDDLSLHQALPVTKGEKWLCNFWVWDPKKRNK
jgi:prolyl 4-hydroxylase